MVYNRIIKKIIVILLTIVSVFPFVEVQAKENAYDVWKKESLIYPSKGQLVPAGEIEIQFSGLLNTDFDVESYDIYLDGVKQKTVKDIHKETYKSYVYTTKTSSHTVQIVAKTKENQMIHSSVRTFFVSKKGMGLDSQAKMNDMNLSWYYNWSLTPHKSMKENIQFVPMVYSAYSGASQWLQKNGNSYSHILGFNEPDRQDQANMPVRQAVIFQKFFTETSSIIGAPSVSYDPSVNEWFMEYAKSVDMNDIDFIPVHVYYDWAGEGMAESFLKVIDDTYEKYKKPIWVTEYGVANQWLYGSQAQSEESKQQIRQFMKETIKGLEERTYVERYAWFSFGTDDINGGQTALYNQQTGALTDLGVLYKQLGNPNTSIDCKDKYVEDLAYYGKLDSLIQKAEKIILSDDYQKHYIENEVSLYDALKNAKGISRNLTILQQDQIQHVSTMLEKEINQLKLKSADYQELYQVMKEAMKYIGENQALKSAYEEANHLDKHLLVKQQNVVDTTCERLKNALQKFYEQRKDGKPSSPQITVDYANTYIEFIVENITEYVYEEDKKLQTSTSNTHIEESKVPQASTHQKDVAQRNDAKLITLISIGLFLLLIVGLKRSEKNQ